MNVIKYFRLVVPSPLKKILRVRKLEWRISKLLSPYLPESICVDVGASFYPHAKWLQFLNAPKTNWIAVEPNKDNISYVYSWSWPSNINACTTGLSHGGGPQTLFITNVDTGSSLLPPEITPSMRQRINNTSYFFPTTEKKIETLTLEQVVEGVPSKAPIYIKLDTQGTELSILQGGQALFDNRRIVGVEMESTMLAQPLMKGSGKFWQACEFMEQQGFELLTMDPIHAPSRSSRSNRRLKTYLNECDAVYAVRPDLVASLSVDYKVSLFAFYITYFFYEEAMALAQREADIFNFLSDQGCNVRILVKLLDAAIDG